MRRRPIDRGKLGPVAVGTGAAKGLEALNTVSPDSRTQQSNQQQDDRTNQNKKHPRTSGLSTVSLTAFRGKSYGERLRLPPTTPIFALILFADAIHLNHGGGTEKAAGAAHGRYVRCTALQIRSAYLSQYARRTELTTLFPPTADQLIGTGAQGRNSQLTITDPKVCRSYLVGTCPHDLFTNTKQDLGPCPKVHSEGLKTEYETASPAEKAKWGFDFDYMRDMQKYIDDCDRRIETAQRRLEKTPDEIRQTNDLVRFPGLLEARCLN
ncbi:U1 snRNP-associated protein [Penicillium riverlandense]|uniref:U1 snRNP-associated protein n=1 Tax=Penicillium riverlandense TaxID=1903569 RepID=UPI0025488878|nr:U1 snRNP-associated protein [Penicillium riverlandense]KAJ5826114.1 U1 snRNP-associated protein [Penicillium riverlandense]